MSTTDQDGPTWFLARDGQQYGPITSVEMKKIIELGQLADTDLVWNETLTEWAPAEVAINALAPPPEPVRPPEPTPTPRPASELPPAPQADPYAARPTGAEPGGYTPRETYEPGPAQPTGAAYADPRTANPYAAQQPAASQPGYDAGVAPTRPDRPQTGERPVTVDSQRRAMAVEDRYDDDDESDGGGSVALKAIAAGLLIALVGGGGWFAYQNRASLMSMVDQTGANAANAPVVRANETASNSGQPALRTTTATPANTTTTETARAAFLETVAWRSVTSTFPTWASEREQQASSMLQSGQSQTDVRKHLIDEIAKLRRKHANDALAASPTALRSVATAFLTNLRTLTDRSPAICYEFISKGETSPQILPLLDDTQTSPLLLKQMHTVIDAIADGRTSPQTYLPPRQSDYSLISTELSKMGWTGSDMRLFGDPQKLAAASPEKVCQLVTDWFTAQLLISDQAIQSRLLVQSLRPVVAG